MDLQTRFAPLTETKTRDGVVEGYGSVFGVLDSYGTTIEAGAFTRSLEEWKKRGEMPGLFLQHDSSMPMGAWEEITEDERGLKVRGQLARSALGDHVAELFDLGAIRGLSIGFIPRKWREDGKVTRFEDVDLYEVSVVARPANARAKAKLRAVADVRAGIVTIRDFEAALVEHLGFSSRAAKAIATAGFKAGEDRDDPPAEPGPQRRDDGDRTLTELARAMVAWTDNNRGR